MPLLTRSGWTTFKRNPTAASKIVPYWGETLIGGDETIAELKAGTADMAFAALYTNLGYEITSALPLFLYGSPSADVNYRVSLEIFDKYPQYQQEFAGLVPLGYLSAQQYYLISNKSIATLGDVKGLKINAGVESQSYFNPLGASVTKLPTSEWYSSLEKGIIDSIFIAVDTLQSFKLAEVCKYCNLNPTAQFS